MGLWKFENVGIVEERNDVKSGSEAGKKNCSTSQVAQR